MNFFSRILKATDIATRNGLVYAVFGSIRTQLETIVKDYNDLYDRSSHPSVGFTLHQVMQDLPNWEAADDLTLRYRQFSKKGTVSIINETDPIKAIKKVLTAELNVRVYSTHEAFIQCYGLVMSEVDNKISVNAETGLLTYKSDSA